MIRPACPVGSCNRHGRCMYRNHPRCPFRDKGEKAGHRPRGRRQNARVGLFSGLVLAVFGRTRPVVSHYPQFSAVSDGFGRCPRRERALRCTMHS